DPQSRIVASGLGYIDLASAHPARFRLMFSSARPDRDGPHFSTASLQPFQKPVSETAAVADRNPSQDQAGTRGRMASWALVHGLAELIVSGRAERPLGLAALQRGERDAVLTDILQRLAASGVCTRMFTARHRCGAEAATAMTPGAAPPRGAKVPDRCSC